MQALEVTGSSSSAGHATEEDKQSPKAEASMSSRREEEPSDTGSASVDASANNSRKPSAVDIRRSMSTQVSAAQGPRNTVVAKSSTFSVSSTGPAKPKSQNPLSTLITDYDPEPTLSGEVECVECCQCRAAVMCRSCNDALCTMCDALLHKRGNRKLHVRVKIGEASVEQPSTLADSVEDSSQPSSSSSSSSSSSAPDNEAQSTKSRGGLASIFSAFRGIKIGGGLFTTNGGVSASSPQMDWWQQEIPDGRWFEERSKYIPLRLPLPDRKYMRLVLAAVSVCPDPPTVIYTSPKQQARVVFDQLKSISGVLTGLVLGVNFKVGQQITSQDAELKDHASYIQAILELCRRHKIRNPEKMRGEYGKLMYLMQDCAIPQVAEELGFSVYISVRTVYSLLQQHGALELLSDPLLPIATGEILAEGKSRPEINRLIKTKETAVAELARKYARDKLSMEEVKQGILAIGDNHNYLRFNRDPCETMIKWLRTKFNPDKPTGKQSLSIVEGENGSRLTHSHKQQYQYALQTLTLWKNILHNMYKLWYLSEEDLLDPENPYTVQDNGRGPERLQACPRVSACMRRILYHTQEQLQALNHPWVGSSTIHLGDANVPNALMFIDKYNQVPRMLLPIVQCISKIDWLCESKDIRRYVDRVFGGPEELRLEILGDFLRGAFDGSGADNFFAAGSCIDGRLTSAWNWCSQLEHKSFYRIFLMTGFTSFDGKF